jgi:MFS family permease
VNRNVRLVLGAIFCLFMVQTMVSVLIPVTASRMGLGGLEIGILIGLPGAVGLFTDVPSAALSDAIGRRPLMLGGSVLLLLAAGVFIFSGSPFQLTMAVLVYAVALSVTSGSALALVTEVAAPDRHAGVQGYNGAIQGLSAFVGALAVGVLIQGAPARWAFVSVGLVVLPIAVAVLLIRERVRRLGRRLQVTDVFISYRRAASLIRGSPQIQLAGLVGMNYGFVFLIVGNSFFPLYALKTLSLPAVFVGALLGYRSIVATLVSFFFGRTVARLGFRRAMLASNTLAAIGILLMPWSSTPVMLMVSATLQGMGCGFSAAIANLLVTSATPSTERALGFSSISFISRSGSLLFPLLLGRVLDVAGMRVALIAAGGLSVLCVAGLSGLSISRGRRIDWTTLEPTRLADAGG